MITEITTELLKLPQRGIVLQFFPDTTRGIVMQLILG
jgi:hypothetical protein